MDFISFFSHASSICVWSAVFSSCLSCVLIEEALKMSFSRQNLVQHLNNYGKSILESDYREAIEKSILVHFDLLREELSDPKKFRVYCTRLASKVKGFYEECDQHFDRLFDNHQVISH